MLFFLEEPERYSGVFYPRRKCYSHISLEKRCRNTVEKSTAYTYKKPKTRFVPFNRRLIIQLRPNQSDHQQTISINVVFQYFIINCEFPIIFEMVLEDVDGSDEQNRIDAAVVLWVVRHLSVLACPKKTTLMKLERKMRGEINPYPPKCWRSWNFFIPIIHFTHFWVYSNCLEFKKTWTSRTEDMGMCTIAHNGNTRDKSGRFYKVTIYIYILHLFSFILVLQFEVLRILIL